MKRFLILVLSVITTAQVSAQACSTAYDCPFEESRCENGQCVTDPGMLTPRARYMQGEIRMLGATARKKENDWGYKSYAASIRA